MIRLDVDVWCDNCPEFQPRVRKLSLYNSLETLITCEHRDRCECIKNSIKDAIKMNIDI